jgi:hypothetical protein
LSLPQNVADPVPYIISGLIPIEGQIHLKILTFMYSIFLLPEDSTEKKLLYEQVNVYWKNYMIEMLKLYKSIYFLNTEIYKPGKQHPLIYIKTVSTRDANRIPITLKVVSGQYIL